MFVSKFGGRATSCLPPAASRLFASSLPKSVDRDAAPSAKPDVAAAIVSLGDKAGAPAPPASPSAVPQSLKTGGSSKTAAPSPSSSSSSTGAAGPLSSSPSTASPSAAPAPAQPSLASIVSSSSLRKPAFALPTVLSQDWLFAGAPPAFSGSLFDADAPDPSLWALESEIVTWFPPSHPHIGRSTPALAHAAAVARSAALSGQPKHVPLDEDETYFALSLQRQLALAQVGAQATPDRGVSVAGERALRILDDMQRSFGDAREAEDADDGLSIRLDSVVRKRKKKMSKHKYKKRQKVRDPPSLSLSRPPFSALLRRPVLDAADDLFVAPGSPPPPLAGPEDDAEEARKVGGPGRAEHVCPEIRCTHHSGPSFRVRCRGGLAASTPPLVVQAPR